MKAFGTRMRGGLATMLSVALIVSGALLAAPSASAEELTPQSEAAAVTVPAVETPAEEIPVEVAPTEDAVTDVPAEDAVADGPADVPAADKTEASSISVQPLADRVAPQLSVSKTTELDAEGEMVTVTGSGYNPEQAIYVFICADTELPADLWTLALGCQAGAKQIGKASSTSASKFNADGSFNVDISVKQLGGAATSLYTAANHTGMADRSQDAKVALSFAEETPAPVGPAGVVSVSAADQSGVTFSAALTGLEGSTLPNGVYVGVIEAGTAETATLSSIVGTAWVRTVGASGEATQAVQAAASSLDRSKSYEVLVWRGHTNPSAESNVLVLPAAVTAEQWDAVFPAAVSVTASVTAATGAGLTLSVQLDDVVIPDGKWGAYVGVIEKDRVSEYGTDAGAGMVEAFLTSTKFLNGSATAEVIVPVEKKDRVTGATVRTLDPSAEYVVVSWLAHGFLTEDAFLAQQDLSVTEEQWAAVFPAADGVQATTSVTAQGLKVEVAATGLPGAIYAALIERGTGANLDMADPDSYAAFALPFPKVTDGAASFSLIAPADKLDQSKKYEVLVWKIHSLPNADTIYGLAEVDVTAAQWEQLFPTPAGPTLKASVTGASEAGLELSVSLADVEIPAGKFGAYVGVIEKDRVAEYGADAGAGMVEHYLKTSDFVNGSATLELDVLKEKKDRDGTTTIRSLDPSKEYVVVSWLAHGFLTDEVKVAQQDLVVTQAQWDAVFRTPGSVQATASVTDQGLKVDVSATGLPGGIYAALIERGTGSKLDMGDPSSYVAFAQPFPTVTDGATSFAFVAPMDKLNRKKQYEVLVWKIHSMPNGVTIYGQANVEVTKAQWDELEGVKPPVEEPVVTPKPKAPGAGSLTWGVSTPFADYVIGKIAQGTVATNGVGGGRGGYVFPQATGSSWNAETRTGTVYYSGSVTFIGHGGLLRETFANPVITVTSPISGTISASGRSFPLNLASARFSADADGSATWSNVSVSGVISGGDGGGSGGALSVDSLSFTVGVASGMNFGSTSTTSKHAATRTAAATPPSATGLTVVTPAANLVAGGEIEISAGGFEPNEQGILVVIYSEPTVLDTKAKADKNGFVRWIGKLPKDLTGKHTITLQGSVSVGQEITIAAAESLAKAKKAVVAPAVANEMQNTSALPDTGVPAWIWWAGALALIVAAGATTGLVVAQRRKNAVPGRS